jgi:hypothetical protein
VLPSFIVIGAKKTGTTSLYRYLRAHPAVWLPESKRLEFFSGEHWHRGVEWYEAQFAGSASFAARGEISTSYTRYPVVPHVPERMHGVVPDVRLVYVIREPVARIVSHYRYALTEGWETRSIDEAVLADSAEYVAPSRYAMQLERYLARFQRDQLLVITSEDLRDRRAATLASVYRFIGVDDAFVPHDLDRTHHEGSALRRAPSTVRRLRRSAIYRRLRPLVPSGFRDRAWHMTTRQPEFAADQFDLSPATRAELLDRIRPDLVALRAIVGGDFHCWGHLDGR